jgi:alkylhydroperoxidase family enzyme
VKLLGWMARRLGWKPGSAVPGTHAVAGYLALSRLPSFGSALDNRLALLAGALAAELSGCRWCIDRARHDSRSAGLSPELLGKLSAYSMSHGFSQRERAALTFVETVSRAAMGLTDGPVLQRAREFLSEGELAELTAIVAEHHCAESLNSGQT